MGILKNTLAMAGALALVSTPVIAQAAGKQPVAERTAEATGDESNLEGAGWFLLPAALVAIIVGIVIAVQQEGDSPSSPG